MTRMSSPTDSRVEHKGAAGAIVDVKSSTIAGNSNDTTVDGTGATTDTSTTTTALLTAVSLVSRLASLDARHYQEEMSSTPTCCTSTSTSTSSCSSVATTTSDDSTSSTLTSTQSQLDDLQSHWTLEDTSLPHLIESIHRLQSNAILLQDEAATATEEVAALQTALSEHRARERSLERIVRRLLDENERLQKTLAQRRKKSKVFARNVREAMGGLKGMATSTAEDDSRNDADTDVLNASADAAVVQQLQTHEVILKRASSASNNSRRQRALTADSALFSDLDESAQCSPFRSYNYDYDFSSSARSSRVLYGDDNDIESNGHTIDNDNTDDDGEASVSSISSAPLLVTERSMPTISLKATASFPPSPAQIDSTTLFGDDEGDEEDEIETPRNVYRLTIPVGRQIGIELQRVPLKQRKEDANEAPVNVKDRLDDSSEHSFSLADAAAEVSSDIKAIGTLLGNVGKNALLSVTSDEARGTTSEQIRQQNLDPDSAFLVCGYCDTFDSILNKRPPIGSRLITIDDVSLEAGAWSFAKVKTCILHKSRSKKASTFTLTFRMDPLNEEQRTILVKAVAFSKRKEDDKLMGKSRQVSEEKDDFLLVPPHPVEVEKHAQQKANESVHSVSSTATSKSTQKQQKDTLPPAPGPEEMKLALKAFSVKMKAIL